MPVWLRVSPHQWGSGKCTWIKMFFFLQKTEQEGNSFELFIYYFFLAMLRQNSMHKPHKKADLLYMFLGAFSFIRPL
jgi:hypothetical protein